MFLRVFVAFAFLAVFSVLLMQNGAEPLRAGSVVQDSGAAESAASDVELTKRVEQLERDLASMTEFASSQKQRLDRHELWFAALRAEASKLDGKMDQARKDGFEFAGPNPKAKAAVLDGIKALAATLGKSPDALAKEAAEAKKPAPRGRGRGRRR